jgi:hypothetical protein
MSASMSPEVPQKSPNELPKNTVITLSGKAALVRGKKTWYTDNKEIRIGTKFAILDRRPTGHNDFKNVRAKLSTVARLEREDDGTIVIITEGNSAYHIHDETMSVEEAPVVDELPTNHTRQTLTAKTKDSLLDRFKKLFPGK